jgi:hypothetical protein
MLLDIQIAKFLLLNRSKTKTFSQPSALIGGKAATQRQDLVPEVIYEAQLKSTMRLLSPSRTLSSETSF